MSDNPNTNPDASHTTAASENRRLHPNHQIAAWVKQLIEAEDALRALLGDQFDEVVDSASSSRRHFNKTSPIPPDARLPQPTLELQRANAALREEVERRAMAEEEINAMLEEIRQQNDELAQSQQIVEEERQRYQTLFNFAPDAYLVTDRQGQITEANEAARALFGKDLIGHNLATLIDVTDQPAVFAYLNAIHSTAPVQHLEICLHRADETAFPASVTVAAACDMPGQPIHLRWLVHDITELVQAQEQVASLARFPDENPNPVLRIDQSNRLLYINRAGLAVFGNWEWLIGQPAPLFWQDLLAQARASTEQETIQISCLERVYALDIQPVTGARYTNIYGRDITEREQMEAALRESEEKYRRIVETANEGIWITNADRKTTFVNQRMADMLGYTKEEMLGKPPSEFLGEDQEPLALKIRGQLKAGEKTQQEFMLHRKDGSTLWAISTASPVFDIDGRLNSTVSMLTDITERKRAEDERQSRTAELEAIFAAQADAILIYSPEMNARRVNPSFIATYGFNPVGLNVKDIAQRVACRRLDGRPLVWGEQPTPRALRGEQVAGACFVVTRADGTEATIETSARPMRVGERIIGSVTLWHDITEHIQTAQALRQTRDELEIRVHERTLELEEANAVLEEEIEERQRAEALVRQNAQRVAALAEISHALVEVGPAYQAVLDRMARSIALFIGDACIIALSSDEGPRLDLVACYHADSALREVMHQLCTAGPDANAEGIPAHVFQTKQPAYLPSATAADLHSLIRPEYQPLLDQIGVSSLLVVPLVTQGQPLGLMALFRTRPAHPYTTEDLKSLQSIADRATLAVTNARLYQDLKTALADEQRIRQQLIQAEKLGAMGRLIGSVSHELNNPLQTITNCLYLTQQRTPSDATAREYLNMAYAETERMTSLVAQLRDLYRAPGASVKQLQNLADLIQAVRILMASQLQSHSVNWQSVAQPGRYWINCAPDRLKQVFINIITNAIEAMQPAGGVLTVDLAESTDGQQIGVSFKDSGPGIAPEHLHTLFEPLFTTKPHGLGLGLAICYEITQQHGGQLTVDSQPGHGATFTVWLPMANDP